MDHRGLHGNTQPLLLLAPVSSLMSKGGGMRNSIQALAAFAGSEGGVQGGQATPLVLLMPGGGSGGVKAGGAVQGGKVTPLAILLPGGGSGGVKEGGGVRGGRVTPWLYCRVAETVG